MTSEHHGGFAGYMPNPLQAAGWLLEAMPSWVGRAVPAPVAAAARRPRGGGGGVARGALPGTGRGRPGGGVAARRLRHHGPDQGRPDAALRRAGSPRWPVPWAAPIPGCSPATPPWPGARHDPVPVLSAAMSARGGAARRAPRRRPAVRLALHTPARPGVDRRIPRRPAGTGRACSSGGCGWARRPPSRSNRQLDRYRSYASRPEPRRTGRASSCWPTTIRWRWGSNWPPWRRRPVSTPLNLRIHVPGVAPTTAREQIGALGEVVALVGAARTTPPTRRMTA